MKKFENVLVDLLGCGKTILHKKAAGNRLPVAGNRIQHQTWPSSYRPPAAGHLLLIGGEGTVTALKCHERLLLAAQKVPSLTLPNQLIGEKS